jgi:hypothetical protein
MSKLLLLSLLALMASCNGGGDTVSDSVGEVQRYEPMAISENDNARIRTICQALSYKQDLINEISNSGREYTFGYAEKGCSDRDLPGLSNVVTTVELANGTYNFKPKNNARFGFTNVETYSNGIMNMICQNQVMGTLMSPLQSSSTGAMWFTTNTSSDHCTSDANNICIHIQRGSAADNVTYKIHTNEWIKFRTTNDRRGFFVERKLISSADCSNGGNVERRAVIR